MSYLSPPGYPRLRMTGIVANKAWYETQILLTEGLIDDFLGLDLPGDCPSIVLLSAYFTLGGEPFPPIYTLDDYFLGDLGPYSNGAHPYSPPPLSPPDPTADYYTAGIRLRGLRFQWYVARYRARLLVATAFHDGRHRLGLDTMPPGPKFSSMAYGNSGKKNAGAWFRINEIVRHNSRLKVAINGDSEIQTAMTTMLTAVKDIALANGLPLASTENIAAKSHAAFPITKQFWLGYLPFSTYTTAGADEHRKEFASAASDLRDRATGLVKSFKLLVDAFNESDDANPGGVVGP